jgi:hypothetical protein
VIDGHDAQQTPGAKNQVRGPEEATPADFAALARLWSDAVAVAA